MGTKRTVASHMRMHNGVYCDFFPYQGEEKEFRDNLLHNENGFTIYRTTLFDTRFIILPNDTVDLSNFLCEHKRLESEDKQDFSRSDLNTDTLKYTFCNQ